MGDKARVNTSCLQVQGLLCPKPRLCLVIHPNIDTQLTITKPWLIKPQTPALSSLLSSPLGGHLREAELDPTLRRRAPRGTSGTLPPAQEEPCLAHGGRHWTWRAWGSCPPPQDLGCRPIRVGSDPVGPNTLPWKEIPARCCSWPAANQSIGSNPFFFLTFPSPFFPLLAKKFASYSVRLFKISIFP